MEGTEDRKGLSVENPRNGGIGGVDGGGISGIEVERDNFGRPVAEIDDQGVLGDFGQTLTDRKRLTERVFETSISFPKVSCPVRPNLLIQSSTTSTASMIFQLPKLHVEKIPLTRIEQARFETMCH